jgi:acetoin utilization deacetylase AcuC-like enzyme
MTFSEELAHACLLSAGGTIEACRRACQERVAVNLGGGFHHAHADHGEGFCVLNDIAVGIASCLDEGRCHEVMVVDCDVHQGNGTAAIFRGNPRVFTVSLHQENNYPMPKAKSSLDVGIRDGAGDEEYLWHLDSALDAAFGRFQPELLIYVAGADPYEQDQLGGLSLTLDGLLRRDEIVLARSSAEGCATVITLAGGYARNVSDTVTIHVNTILAAQRQYEKTGRAGE